MQGSKQLRRRAAILTTLAAAAAAASPALAQSAPATAPRDGLNLSGSVRLRYENLSGQFRPGFDKSEDAILLRTILTGEYRSGNIRFGAELWDSRAWGARGAFVGTGEVNTAELVQAYVAADLDDPLGEGSRGSVQLGRMALNLGSRRLIASDDYRNTTNGFTEGRVRYWLVPAKLRAEGNAALLLKDGLLRDAPNVPSRKDTIYTSLALTATF